MNGNVEFSSGGIVLDLIASTEGFEWEKINRIAQAETTKKEAAAATKASGASEYYSVV